MSENWKPDVWAVAANCSHAAFDALDTPRQPMEQCPTCGTFLRTITTADGWAGHWAEQLADERAESRTELRAREEDARW